MRLRSVGLHKFVLIAGLLSPPACDPGAGAESAASGEMDEAQVRARTQEKLSRLDSREFAAKVRDDEFLVKAFMLVNGRAPDALEFHVLRGVAQEGNLDRSDILTMMLADK